MDPLKPNTSRVFTDLDQALNHLVRHVGLSQLMRGGKTCDLHEYGPERILLALLTERGTTAEATAFFAPYQLGGTAPAARNLLFSQGAPRAHAPVAPGELFWSRGAAGSSWGVALETTAAGEPTRYITVQYQGSTATILEVKATVALDDILLVTSPSLDPRLLPDAESASPFYRRGETLRSLMQTALGNLSLKVHVGQNDVTLSSSETRDFPRIVAQDAPEWIRLRFLRTSSVSEVREVAASLGEGVRTYDGRGPVPYGAWAFLPEGGFGLVVANTPQGAPAVLLQAASGGHEYVPVAPEQLREYWLPSVQPYAYVNAPKGEAYTDLNRLIGKVRLWGSLSEYEVPLLHQGYFLDPECLSPEMIQVFRGGPAGTDWGYYLNEYGSGLLPAATPPAPGDFVLFRMGDLINQALYLGGGEMAYVDRRKSSNFAITRPEQVLAIWRPSPAKRTA